MTVGGTYVIKLVALANGAPHPHVGAYVKAFDVDALRPDGIYDGGHLIVTRCRADALRLSRLAAFELYRSTHGTRPDGKPNRPLTAFTIEISPI